MGLIRRTGGVVGAGWALAGDKYCRWAPLLSDKRPRMAQSLTSIIALVGLLAVVGCQPTASTSMVQSLPPPNFSGPSLEEHSAQQRPVAQAPQAPAPVVVVPKA